MPRKPRADANKYKTLSSLAYKKHAGTIEAGLQNTGFHLDNQLSDGEHKVFFNPATKKAVVAYRGTDMHDPKRIWSDLRSDFNIMLGQEKNDKRFQNANAQFELAAEKYKKQGYTLDTTGHSLGGSLATHVNRSNPNQVRENLSFSRGAGFVEPFRKRPKNSWDYSHKRDIVSLGARLSKDERGGYDQSVVSQTKVKNALNAHNMERLQTEFM